MCWQLWVSVRCTVTVGSIYLPWMSNSQSVLVHCGWCVPFVQRSHCFSFWSVGCESILALLCIQLLCRNMMSQSSVSLLPSSFTVLSVYSLNADRNENRKGNTVLLLFISLCVDFPCPCWTRRFITVCTDAHYMIILWRSWLDTRFISWLLCLLMRYEPSVHKRHSTTFFTLYSRSIMGKNHIRCLIMILHMQQEKSIFPHCSLLHP